jgi:hypothetical protein
MGPEFEWDPSGADRIYPRSRFPGYLRIDNTRLDPRAAAEQIAVHSALPSRVR